MRCFCAANTCDASAHLRPRRIAARDVWWHWPATRLGTLKLRHQPASIEQSQITLAAIGGVGPHAAGRIIPIEQPGKLTAVMPRGVGDDEASDEAVRAVDTEMVLVAEHRHCDLAGGLTLHLARWRRLLAATLDRPAAIAVDLPRACL
jgi:hypothetical protein